MYVSIAASLAFAARFPLCQTLLLSHLVVEIAHNTGRTESASATYSVSPRALVLVLDIRVVLYFVLCPPRWH